MITLLSLSCKTKVALCLLSSLPYRDHPCHSLCGDGNRYVSSLIFCGVHTWWRAFFALLCFTHWLFLSILLKGSHICLQCLLSKHKRVCTNKLPDWSLSPRAELHFHQEMCANSAEIIKAEIALELGARVGVQERLDQQGGIYSSWQNSCGNDLIWEQKLPQCKVWWPKKHALFYTWIQVQIRFFFKWLVWYLGKYSGSISSRVLRLNFLFAYSYKPEADCLSLTSVVFQGTLRAPGKGDLGGTIFLLVAN